MSNEISDVKLILQLQKELKDNPNPPVFDVKFDPLDPVAVEMTLLEGDYAIDASMEPYRDRYRPQFVNPEVYDNYVMERKKSIRKIIRQAVESARMQIQQSGYDPEVIDPFKDSDE